MAVKASAIGNCHHNSQIAGISNIARKAPYQSLLSDKCRAKGTHAFGKRQWQSVCPLQLCVPYNCVLGLATKIIKFQYVSVIRPISISSFPTQLVGHSLSMGWVNGTSPGTRTNAPGQATKYYCSTGRKRENREYEYIS